jgi:hypothetical protein
MRIGQSKTLKSFCLWMDLRQADGGLPTQMREGVRMQENVAPESHLAVWDGASSAAVARDLGNPFWVGFALDPYCEWAAVFFTASAWSRPANCSFHLAAFSD